MDQGKTMLVRGDGPPGLAAVALKWAGLSFVVLAFVVIAFFSCGEKGPFQPYVATVNGQKVYLAELEEKLQEEIALLKGLAPLAEDEFNRIRHAVLDSIILEKLLLQRAGERNISVSNEEVNQALQELQGPHFAEEFQKATELNQQDWSTIKDELRNRLVIDKLLDREVFSRIVVSEAEARAFFLVNRSKYGTHKAAHVTQIVVREKAKAEKALKRLKTGEAFAVVARDISIGPEALLGGDLGYVDAGSMPESFDAVAFSLPVGKVSGIIKTSYGYHIIKVIERNDSAEPTFDRLRRRVMTDLKRIKQEDAYRRWTHEMKMGAVINIREDVK